MALVFRGEEKDSNEYLEIQKDYLLSLEEVEEEELNREKGNFKY